MNNRQDSNDKRKLD